MLSIYFKEINKDAKPYERQMGLAIAVIGVFTTLGMMHGDSTLSTPEVRRMLSIPNYLCSAFLLYQVFNHYEINKDTILLTFSVFIYWGMYSINSYTGEIVSPLLMLTFILYLLTPRKAKLAAFKFFRLYLIVISLLGIMAFIMYLTNLGLRYEEVPYYSTRFNATYINYGFAYLLSEGVKLRLCCLFAEPGAVGTLTALCLIADGYNLHKKENIILLVAGVLAFSLAFYLMTAVYLLFNLIKNRKVAFLLFFIVLLGSFFLPKLAEYDEGVAQFISRFDNIENLYKRTTEEFDLIYDRMFDTGDWAFGYGTGYLEGKNLGSSGYRTQVIQQGVVGFLIVYGFYLMVVANIAKRDKRTMLYFLIYLLVVYKTGQMVYYAFFILLFGGIEYIKTYNINKTSKCNGCYIKNN